MKTALRILLATLAGTCVLMSVFILMDKGDPSWWAAICAGIFAGAIAVSVFGRWLRFVFGLRLSSSPSQTRILGVPVLAYAHPTPWLCLVGLPYVAYYFVHVRSSSAAAHFFTTIGIVVLLWVVASVLITTRLQKKRRADDALRSNQRLERP